MAFITGLNPLGEKFIPTLEITNEFTIKRFSFKKFTIDNHYQEHIAFLTLWLSYYVFCSSFLQVAKKFLPLSIQLHEGQKISLSKLLLANLYQSLGEASYKLKHLPETNKSYLFSSRLWLLQIWLNATFEPKLHITESLTLIEQTGGIAIEDTRLGLTTPYGTPLTNHIYEIYRIIHRIDHLCFDHGSFRGLMRWSILVHKQISWCIALSRCHLKLLLSNLFYSHTSIYHNQNWDSWLRLCWPSAQLSS